MKVAVFGMGYVGTVTAAVLAANGHEVRTVDVDPHKIAMINAGVSPVNEGIRQHSTNAARQLR